MTTRAQHPDSSLGKCTHCAGYGYRRDFDTNTCAEFDPNGACAAGTQACPHHACYWCAGSGTADAPAPITAPGLPDRYADEFATAYIECALWSESAGITVADDGTVTSSPDDDTSFVSHNFDASDLTAEAEASMRADCDAFIADNTVDLLTVAGLHRESGWTSAEQSGHDFWLTRNGHGAGFWDRGYGAVGGRLSNACDPYGESHLMANFTEGCDVADVSIETL